MDAPGSAEGRSALVHVDDVGMCEATVSAYDEILASGLPVSASAMVPCGWFPAAARLCRARPDADMGVHLTLTSEWDAYRWGPVSTRDPASGLLDAEGCFPRTVAPVYAGARTDAVAAELDAQLAAPARRASTSPTSTATWRCSSTSASCPSTASSPAAIACPLFNARWDARLLQSIGVDSETVGPLPGFPAFARAWMSPLDRPDEDPFERVRRTLAKLPLGMTQLIFHPARDGTELRAIAPDHRARVADFEVLRSGKLARWLEEEGIAPVTYRALRDAFRARAD